VIDARQLYQRNRELARELSDYATQGEERLRELERERRELERSIPLAKTAARALAVRGRAPAWARDDAPPQIVDLHVLSSTRPTPAELEDRELVHTTEEPAA
jgi:uncharacterized protein HemX